MISGGPWDVLAYKHVDPLIPHHSTLGQFYTNQRFEAYGARETRGLRAGVRPPRTAAFVRGSDPPGARGRRLALIACSTRPEAIPLERNAEGIPDPNSTSHRYCGCLTG